MADLLTHVLVVFAGLTILSWRFDVISDRYIPVAMVGAILPDLNRVMKYFIEASDVSELLGMPFSWIPIHRLGGTIVLVLFGALLFRSGERRRTFVFLLVGALSHYPLDAGVRRADGLTPPYFYPLTWWQAPSPNLYLSSDLSLVIPSILFTGMILYIDKSLLDT